jgi:mRNA interferase RelE/StbE
MAYVVELETRAKREFLGLSRDIRQRIADAIDDLQTNPRPPGAKTLTGHSGYRIRTGSYRVLYTVSDRERMIRIYRIGHRRDVYRGL